MEINARMRRQVADARRRAAIGRLRLAARRAGADLDLSVAPTARLGRIDARFAPGVVARLHIGEHTVVDDGVELRFNGGSVHVGEWCEIRAGVRVMAAGDLDLAGQNLLSWGVVVHCDDSITLHRQVVLSEYVTVTDSVHEHEDGAWHLDRVRTGPVVVGVDTWIGAKATVTHGVRIGEHCVVAAGAVVTRDVADRHVALGIPAVSRPLGEGTADRS